MTTRSKKSNALSHLNQYNLFTRNNIKMKKQKELNDMEQSNLTNFKPFRNPNDYTS